MNRDCALEVGDKVIWSNPGRFHPSYIEYGDALFDIQFTITMRYKELGDVYRMNGIDIDGFPLEPNIIYNNKQKDVELDKEYYRDIKLKELGV